MIRKLFFSALALVMLFSLTAVQACDGAQAPQIEDAIVKGLAWLDGQQQPGGSWQYSVEVETDQFDVATTGLVVLKFEERAKELGKDPFNTSEYEYAQNVIDGLDYIFTYLTVDPDGFHYPTLLYCDVYTTGIVMAAVAASNNPTRVITTGPLIGYNYQYALQGMMDWMAFAQSNTGGWAYTPTNYNNSADNSVSGYATLGIGYAAADPPDGFGLIIPASVTTGLNTWINNIQVSGGLYDGGSAYQSVPTGIGVNTLKTGNLLYELALAHIPSADSRVTRALDFIGTYWGANGGETDGAGWIGDYQAMFTMMKGLEAYGFDDVPAHPDWFDEVSTYIVDNQKPDGHWESIYEGGSSTNLSTAWALLTLERAVPQITLNQTPTPTPTLPCNCTPTWNIMASGTTDDLYGIWGSSASDVYAVGGWASSGTILHYDGNSQGTWSSMTSGTTAGLIDIWGSSASDVYAVGGGGTILHYGSSPYPQGTWSPMNSGTTKWLGGIWGTSSSNVYAVGDDGTILHYSQGAWSPMTSGTTEGLEDIWGSSPNDIYAVGDNGTILHYTQGTWSPMNSGTTEWLGGIWGSSSSDVYAVGDQGTILHYTQGAWSPAGFGASALFLDIWGSSSSDIFIGEAGTAVPHYDGVGWNLMPTGTSMHEFQAVWGSSPCDVYVVGSGGDTDGDKILHYYCPPVTATQTPTSTNTTPPTPTSTLSACNCSQWSPITVTWDGAAPETQITSNADTVTIPWVYQGSAVIISSGISCYPANCNRTYNLSVWKSGGGMSWNGPGFPIAFQPIGPGSYTVILDAHCGETTCTGIKFYINIEDVHKPPDQSSCAQTINYSACNCDNFSAPIESPSPNAALLSWINTHIGNGSIPGSRNCDDNTTLNQYWAHTFQTWVPPTGCQIQSAILTIQVHNGDTNDALGLGFLSGGQTWSFWQHLTDLGVPVGSNGQIVLDLGNLPGALSLLADIQYFGCLDVAVQDDSGVDCATLTVTYGP